MTSSNVKYGAQRNLGSSSVAALTGNLVTSRGNLTMNRKRSSFLAASVRIPVCVWYLESRRRVRVLPLAPPAVCATTKAALLHPSSPQEAFCETALTAGIQPGVVQAVHARFHQALFSGPRQI